MYTLEFLPVAKQDLQNIIHYIAHELKNPSAAHNLKSEFSRTLNFIKAFPYSYERYVPLDVLSHDYRKAVVMNYVVFYWIDEPKKIITVARVIYGRRKYTNLLN